jgi:uncharacterized protein
MLSTQHHFYWDPANAISNYRKHGVLFEDASLAIDDPLAMTRHDADRRCEEGSWITLGEADGTLLHVTHTLEEPDGRTIWIGLICARHPTADERRQYESGKYRIQEAIMVNKSNPDQWVRGRFYREGMMSILPVHVARDLVVSLNALAKQRGLTPSELANELLTDAISQPPFVATHAASGP